MTRLVNCTKHGVEAPGLDFAPYPGELGERIYNEICADAWQSWLDRQTMFINEYRLNLMDAKARRFLADEMVKFLFDGEDSKPEGFTPESE